MSYLNNATSRARTNSISATEIHTKRIVAAPDATSANTGVRASSTRVRTVGGDLLAASASRGDLEGLEPGDGCGAGVVPDVDGLRGACATGAAVEGHDGRVGREG